MKNNKQSTTKQAVVAVIVTLLLLAVVMGALGAFTDIFEPDDPQKPDDTQKPDETPDPDETPKPEYKALANGDEVSTLYFNTSREITFYDIMVMSTMSDFGNISSSEYVIITHCFNAESANIYIYYDPDAMAYNRFTLWLYVGKVSDANAQRILLYSESADEANNIEKGWQYETIDLTEYVGEGEKITASFGDKSLALQGYTGQYISTNEGFIQEV